MKKVPPVCFHIIYLPIMHSSQYSICAYQAQALEYESVGVSGYPYSYLLSI